MGMKKFFFTIIFISLIAFWAMPESVRAMVSGTCSFCHNTDVSNCVACHGKNPSGTQNLLPVPNGGPIPQVLHNMTNGDLAGGNFYYVADGFNPDYTKGHSVVGISLQQSAPLNTPPGFKGSVIIPGGVGPSSWPSATQFRCSGTWGCHGDRTIADPYQAIYGAHHTDNSTIDGLSVGTSYRFLNGIKGAQHSTWEYQATVSSHNGYKGDSSYSSSDTISYLCGECHGQFHPNANLGGLGSNYSGVWERHPVDLSFGSVQGGYANSEFKNYTTYNLLTPVAFQNPTGTESTVDSSAIVMCLSCHRAHASPYKKILRWDSQQQTTGCVNCHTQKAQ